MYVHNKGRIKDKAEPEKSMIEMICEILTWKVECMFTTCQVTSVIFTGFSVFVVGVADVDYNELAKIASKPSERHVFIVDDFDAFEKIQDNLVTFVCETATSSE